MKTIIGFIIAKYWTEGYIFLSTSSYAYLISSPYKCETGIDGIAPPPLQPS